MSYKILIADDESDCLEVISKRLQLEGYQTFTAADGQEALDKIYRENPDIIILDILMPKKNGFEVLKEIRQRPISKWQPVVIVSVKDELENIKKGYDLEADLYITKPFNLELLLNSIKTLIGLISSKEKKENDEKSGHF